MKPDKVTKFGPGTQFRLDKKVIFVEYESMTGEFVKCRFDLSQETEMILNDHRILSFDDLAYLCSKNEEIFIKKALYYEKECHMVIGDKLLIPTKVYFETAGYQADALADSARYIYMSGARRSGKTMWLSNIAKSIEECARNDAIVRWLNSRPIKPLPLGPNGYFDTDMAMTKEEMQYCRNDVAVTEKLFKEEQIMKFESCKPTIKNVIFNNPATIVMWSDGTKTVVKCGENDIFDPEKGVAMCCMKKLLGTNKTGSNYLDKVEGYLNEYYDDAVSVNETFSRIGEILSGFFSSTTGSNSTKDISPEETVEKEFEAVIGDDWKVSEDNE